MIKNSRFNRRAFVKSAIASNAAAANSALPKSHALDTSAAVAAATGAVFVQSRAKPSIDEGAPRR